LVALLQLQAPSTVSKLRQMPQICILCCRSSCTRAPFQLFMKMFSAHFMDVRVEQKKFLRDEKCNREMLCAVHVDGVMINGSILLELCYAGISRGWITFRLRSLYDGQQHDIRSERQFQSIGRVSKGTKNGFFMDSCVAVECLKRLIADVV